jgi:hypothetical protein
MLFEVPTLRPNSSVSICQFSSGTFEQCLLIAKPIHFPFEQTIQFLEFEPNYCFGFESFTAQDRK